MVNMIIATNNFNHAKNMFNSITEMDKNIRIIGISSNKKETIERLKNQSPDILILDFEISERNMIEIQHMLNKQREKEINTKIIIISKNIEKLKKVYGYNEKICYFIDRTYNNDNISKIESLNSNSKKNRIYVRIHFITEERKKQQVFEQKFCCDRW